MLIIAVFLYLVVHLGTYVLWLRHLETFRREKGIFAYHFFSAVILSLLTTGAIVLGDPFTLAAAVGAIALHGIYSISFLELWSLAEGGYSLQILKHIEKGNRIPVGRIDGFLTDIGEAKRRDRVDALQRLHLTRRNGAMLHLTAAGRVIALFYSAIAALCRLQSVG